MSNREIRQEIFEAGVKHWQIAEKLGIHEGNLSRRLRHELPETEKEKIRMIIKQLKQREA